MLGCGTSPTVLTLTGGRRVFRWRVDNYRRQGESLYAGRTWDGWAQERVFYALPTSVRLADQVAPSKVGLAGVDAQTSARTGSTTATAASEMSSSGSGVRGGAEKSAGGLLLVGLQRDGDRASSEAGYQQLNQDHRSGCPTEMTSPRLLVAKHHVARPHAQLHLLQTSL